MPDTPSLVESVARATEPDTWKVIDSPYERKHNPEYVKMLKEKSLGPTQAIISEMFERMSEPSEAVVEAGREAFLKDMRDRRLLKWLFPRETDDVGSIGYIDRPIDLAVQHECASESSEAIFRAMLAKMKEEVGL